MNSPAFGVSVVVTLETQLAEALAQLAECEAMYERCNEDQAEQRKRAEAAERELSIAIAANDHMFDAGRAAGAADERAAVVAWLRSGGGGYYKAAEQGVGGTWKPAEVPQLGLNALSYAIEAGEHRKEPQS